MSREYFTLAIRADGVWAPQFGDYDRDVVAQEIEDSYATVAKADKKIVRSKPGQTEIDARFAAINHAPKTVRLTVTHEINGEYVTPGQTYTVSNPALIGRNGSCSFWSEERHCGTIMNIRTVRRCIERGWLVAEIVAVKPVHAGPVAILVAQTIHWSLSPYGGMGSDAELQRSERDTSMDIADILGASIIRSGMAVVADIIATAGV